MELTVDFNMRDELGRVPALVEGSAAWELHVGDIVLAQDDEGFRCKATVDEIAPTRRIAFLRLVSGTVEESPKTRWIVEESRREILEGLLTEERREGRIKEDA